jgi:cytochrome c-type biogenesis protein CcmH/NrfF
VFVNMKAQRVNSIYHVFQGLAIVPGVVLPIVSIWFLPVVLPSLACVLLLQEQQQKRVKKKKEQEEQQVRSAK